MSEYRHEIIPDTCGVLETELSLWHLAILVLVVWLYYLGNGRESDGAGCFKHGYLTFDDILSLYKEYFAGKP